MRALLDHLAQQVKRAIPELLDHLAPQVDLQVRVGHRVRRE